MIELPKDVFEDTKKNGYVHVDDWERVVYAIKEGTPLPKGHWIQQPRCEGDEQPDLVCPNCGFKISWWDMGNFCAKCGKGLEGGAE